MQNGRIESFFVYNDYYLLAKGVEEEGADEDEGKAEADEEGDDAGDEERGASVLLQVQVEGGGRLG